MYTDQTPNFFRPIYTIQPVVKPVEQPAASCKETFNRLFNRFDNRLYRVNGVLALIFITRSELREVLFWRRQSVFLCMKYLENSWTDLRQAHKEDGFGPSLG